MNDDLSRSAEYDRRSRIHALERRVRNARVVVGIAFFLVVAVYFVRFFWVSKEPISNDQAHWGQLGDYIGGLLNPLVALFAFYWLTESVRLQTQELEETRRTLKDTLKEAETTRQARCFASLYDELNSAEFGEQMENIGIWLDSVALQSSKAREDLDEKDIHDAYRDRIAEILARGENSKKTEPERSRRRVKAWGVKCHLHNISNDLRDDDLGHLITRDRATLLLHVFAMTRGQTAAWKAHSGSKTPTVSSDLVYFELLAKKLTVAHGSFKGAEISEPRSTS